MSAAVRDALQRAAFVKVAREVFAPGKRKACEVCNKYSGLTEAHHLVPLSMQADAGYESPDHSFAWLCPTHHAAVHVLISGIDRTGSDLRMTRSAVGAVLSMPSAEVSACLEISSKAVPFHMETENAV